MSADTIEIAPIEFVNQYRIDQTPDAIRNIRHAATLGLPELKFYQPTPAKFVVVGGAPSAVEYLPRIKELAADPQNAVFALNYTHNWLIENGITPRGCVMFEIDVDPTRVLDRPNPEVQYFVCSVCHRATFDGLQGYPVTVWHAAGDPAKEAVIREDFPHAIFIGGGATTFLRTVAIGLVLGFRDFELFGVDSSFPDEAESTHFAGYPADTKPEVDGFYVWAINDRTGEQRRFRTVGYLCQQAEHFRLFCQEYHKDFRMKVHGDGLLPFIHRCDFPQFYRDAA